MLKPGVWLCHMAKLNWVNIGPGNDLLPDGTLVLEMWKKFYIQANRNDWWLKYLLWNCPQMNIIAPHWWLINIAIRQQAITWANFNAILCHHMESLGHNELI